MALVGGTITSIFLSSHGELEIAGKLSEPARPHTTGAAVVSEDIGRRRRAQKEQLSTTPRTNSSGIWRQGETVP